MIFLLMVAIFALLAMAVRLPIGPALALAALAGALLGGEGPALRHLVEGSFGYFDTILIIAAAMVFMKVLQASGILDTLTSLMLAAFARRRIPLLLAAMFLVMFPGMITGSSTAAVLSTGALVAPVLIRLGLDRVKAAAFIAMGGILGMIAPPVNILVMIMGGGVDMPYAGVAVPLLVIVVPLAVIFAFWFGRQGLRPADKDVRSVLPESLAGRYGFRLFIPLLVVLALLLLQGLAVRGVPDIGIPAIFLIGSAAGAFCGRRFNFWRAAQDAAREAMPILAILAGVGMFIQVMTLTGGRGWTVTGFLSLPPVLLYLGIAASLPLFGAVSAFGSASILGVPFILALIGRNAVITSSALSAVAGLGDLMPPTALAGIFAAQVVGEKNYFRVLRHCLLPALCQLAAGIGVLLAAPLLDKIM